MLYNSKAIVLSVIGGFLFIIGTALAICWPDIFKHFMKKELQLTPNSRAYEMWKSPPIPMFIDIYFFNWTNPEEFLTNTTKPRVEQLGPYRFREFPDKVDIVWHDKNNTSAAAQAKYWDSVKRGTVSVGLTIYSEEIHVTKTARELLFEGYEDSLIDMAIAMPSMTDGKKVPFDKFGWFYTRNGSADLMGHYNMATGVNDISEIGVVKEWNYRNQTPFFPGTCGMVNGSAGEFYPPELKQTDVVSFFSADLCRTLTLDFEKEVEIEGIKGNKYSGGEKTIDNGTKYSENSCFCNGECVPSGVMNISSCRFGTPVFMSFPHYYKSDPFYLTQVEGLKPDEEKHQFYMTLEPSTGVALEVAARLQVNILIESYEGISLYTDVPKTFFPVLWFEQRVAITPSLASDVRQVTYIPNIGRACAIIVLCIGLVMILWVPSSKLFKKSRNSKNKEGQNIDDNKLQKTDTALNGTKDANLEPLLSSKSITPVITSNSDSKKAISDNGKWP